MGPSSLLLPPMTVLGRLQGNAYDPEVTLLQAAAQLLWALPTEGCPSGRYRLDQAR